ncbi:unnamed protein product [Adineta steineri]|uniref:HTH CENPB-type domain-containing protein n=1 Tax=Adineta steineri TaxID=433720 RepID=A0A819MAU0_9BILA|nr:unnamed protein product [Adineta steineri]CAF3976470.1 unnamed protein product [Adineta steineri]
MALRRHLTLHKKIELISDHNNGLSQRALSEKYGVSLGSVCNIVKRKAEYLYDYETNQNQQVKRKLQNLDSQKLDQYIYEWFVQQRSKHIPISGSILQQKALEISEALGDNLGKFKASNGWLEKFRSRHNISHRTINDESSSIDNLTVDDWIQRIPKLVERFDVNNIFNCDESGLFFKALPDKSLTLHKEACKGGKKSKDRFTIMFCVNLTGTEKLKPLIISKSLRPRCFKNIDINKYSIEWKANKTAWMNVKLFDEWISKLNESMRKQNRHIILFLDNAPH